MNRAERLRRASRDRSRKYRARKAFAAAETARQEQQRFDIAAMIQRAKNDVDRQARELVASLNRKCAVCKAPHCSADIGGQWYCVSHGREKALGPGSMKLPSVPMPGPPIPCGHC